MRRTRIDEAVDYVLRERGTMKGYGDFETTVELDGEDVPVTVSFEVEPGASGDRYTPDAPAEVYVDYVERTDTGEDITDDLPLEELQRLANEAPTEAAEAPHPY